MLALLLVAPAPALADDPEPCASERGGKPAVLFRYAADGAVRLKQLDRNQDGRYDECVHYEDGRPRWAESDADRDGRSDGWTFFDAEGRKARFESDDDRDGRADRWIHYDAEGRPVRQEADRNHDGIVDQALRYRDGVPVEQTRDTDQDGRIDRWARYRDGRPVAVEEDRDGDGRAETRAEYDAEGRKRFEEWDTSGDGRFDRRLEPDAPGQILPASIDDVGLAGVGAACYERAEVRAYLDGVRERTNARWQLPPGARPDQAVDLRFRIGADGTVRDVDLVAGDPGIGRSAAAALRDGSPYPAMSGAVRCLAREPITATFRNPTRR